ncbi:hypothetical protein KY495_22795 [Massilia sp. PAMC28688]|uniref:hypothetical protein n=1 Tax=Massilia sp. PAMC28688 TaxID=2861283 RepID=UPI001C632DA1|nr:hypothetical protein [Massilia sp. PAMC28688]QYF93458.1 hypothetical protein KY495_22795 [Massilia sp. PAMC28688]
MNEVSLFRLYALRLVYLLVAIGLASKLVPELTQRDQPWELMQGVVTCMLTAFGLLCVAGVRYPLAMLPVLLWEVLWKTLWMLLVPLPQYLAGKVDPTVYPTLFACSLVIFIYAAIPWPYVYRKYLRGSGERWR